LRNLSFAALVAVAVASALFMHSSLVFAADMNAQRLPGGWVSVSARDDQVLKAARFAMVEQARQSNAELKLLAIKHARQQVVAGYNFSMNLMVLSEGKKRLVIAVVWSKPDGSMELTRWHWV
jgi:hypothetical protein